MTFGLTFDKLLIIGIIAVFVVGPERLPYYASQLSKFVKTLRTMARGARERVREEMGPDFDDIDWKKLDPRQYDPRRIIREALADTDADAVDASEPVSTATTVKAPMESAYAQRQRFLREGRPAPFDSEAT